MQTNGIPLEKEFTVEMLQERMRGYLKTYGFSEKDHYFSQKKSMEGNINRAINVPLYGTRVLDQRGTTISLIDQAKSAECVSGYLGLIPQQLGFDYGLHAIGSIHVVLVEEMGAGVPRIACQKENVISRTMGSRVFITITTLTCVICQKEGMLYLPALEKRQGSIDPKERELHTMCWDMLGSLVQEEALRQSQ